LNPLVIRVMEQPWIYRLWIAPYAEQKLRPARAHNDFGSIKRVLDVGCGPGTNAPHFAATDYLGIDVNPAYIASARRRYRREFVAADATTYEVPSDQRFDFILLNSLLHHLDTPDVIRILRHLQTLLTDDGHIHVLELVLPAEPSVARSLARHDRGSFVRTLAEWRGLLESVLEPVVAEPYTVGSLGVPLWHMLYFKGRAKGAR
jgi:SAM-dependent methyltransferase